MSSPILSDLLVPPAGQGPPKRGPFDYLTKLVIPVLGLIALIVAQLREQRAAMWALIAIVGLSLASGFAPAVGAGLKRWRGARLDERASRWAFLQLKEFVYRFEKFVDTSAADTLQYILLHEVYKGFTDRVKELGIPRIDLWKAWLSHFKEGLDRERTGAAELKSLLNEFFDLVGTYNNSCVSPIFNESPPEFRAGSTDDAKRSLNSFRERFMGFLADYEKFAESLKHSRPMFSSLWSVFSHPKPL